MAFVDRGLATVDAVTQNLRYAWRSLRRRPGLVAAVSLTLALGLGANAAMFGVIDQLLLRAPLYLRDPDAVNRVYLGWHAPRQTWGSNSGDHADARVHLQYLRFRDLTRWTTAFTQTAAFTSASLPVGSGQTAREVMVVPVSATFVSFFDAPPVIGRYFTVEEDSAPSGAAVAVLGYAFWRSQYGGSTGVLGMPLLVGREVYTVIGVAPENFAGVGDAYGGDDLPARYAELPSIFVPLTTFAATAGRFNSACSYSTAYCCGDWLQMIVRRRPGISRSIASSNLTAAFQRSYLAERGDSSAHKDDDEWKRRMPPIEAARPRAMVGSVLAERGPLEGTTARVATWVAGVAGVVLLITCANVAHLLLASARERRGEIALRLALGVSQRRLAGQLLSECLLLAGIAGFASLLVARLAGTVVSTLFLGETGPALLSQPRTLLFVAAATVVAGLMTGLVPALHARRADVMDALKAGSRGGSPDRSRARALLLLLQGALSVVLLVGADLFIRSVQHVRAVGLGFDVDPILYAAVYPRGIKLDSVAGRGLAQQMIGAAKATPGVADAARVLAAPLVGWASANVFLPGHGLVGRLGDFSFQGVSPDYFHTAGTRILRGRGFTGADAAQAPRVAVVSEAMAQALWPGQDAIGKGMQLATDTMPYTTVIGIAENTRQEGPSDDRQLHYYLPFDQLQFDPGTVDLFIRTRGDSRAYEATLRRVLQPLMPGTAYLDLTTLRETLDPQIRPWRLGAVMFLAFGGLALIVAAFGLYSVISYDVTRRTHELGVRIALGARARHVLRLVAADSALFAAIGMVVGGLIAMAGGPLIARLLFAESPRDPVIFGAVVIVLAVAVISATIAPVVRASRVDPATALRAE